MKVRDLTDEQIKELKNCFAADYRLWKKRMESRGLLAAARILESMASAQNEEEGAKLRGASAIISSSTYDEQSAQHFFSRGISAILAMGINTR